MKVSDFQFENPFLEELNFRVNEEFDSKNGEIEMQNSFSVEVQKHTQLSVAKVILKLEVNKENDNAPLKMQISIASNFNWKAEMGHDEVEALLNINAPALLLGYMRPIVANITNSSKFPVFNLPFINFNEQ